MALSKAAHGQVVLIDTRPHFGTMGMWQFPLCRGSMAVMNEVTELLNAVSRGETQAADQLLPLVYDELRRLAMGYLDNERPGQTLQATALVHKAFIRLVGADVDARWQGRSHFLATAALAMRRILIDNARRKRRGKPETALASSRVANEPNLRVASCWF